MADITKEDWLTVDQAARDLQISRATLYTHLNYLGIQRYKFPFDRRTYVLKTDIERVKRFIEANRQQDNASDGGDRNLELVKTSSYFLVMKP